MMMKSPREPMMTIRKTIVAGITLMIAMSIVASAKEVGENQKKSRSFDSTGAFSMLIVGDGGKPGEKLEQNAVLFEKERVRLEALGTPVRATVFMGDNFYPVGLNREASDRVELVRGVLGPLAYSLRQIGRENAHAIPGNHDYYCDMFGPAPYGTCQSGNLYERMIPIWSYHIGPTRRTYAVSEGSKDSVDLLLLNSALFMINSRPNWRNNTDSLRRLLQASAANPSIRWRFIFTHHPAYTFGEHGGYRVWDSEQQRVRFRGNCIADRKDPVKYFQRWAGSFEDNCAPRYKYYIDTLFSLLNETETKVQAMFSGHDHCLQLLVQRKSKGFAPKVHVISGAMAKTSKVRSPFVDPQKGISFYSHPKNTPEYEGNSIHGFAGMRIEGDRMKLWFLDGGNQKRATMGDASLFWFDDDGNLVATE